MLPFSFVEMFFFLSLGITFVLILLIVRHFKQRITETEHKCDTMFEIVQNLAKEVSGIKMSSHHSQPATSHMFMPQEHVFMQQPPMEFEIMEMNRAQAPTHLESVVEELDEDEEDSESDSESDSRSDSDSESSEDVSILYTGEEFEITHDELMCELNANGECQEPEPETFEKIKVVEDENLVIIPDVANGGMFSNEVREPLGSASEAMMYFAEGDEGAYSKIVDTPEPSVLGVDSGVDVEGETRMARQPTLVEEPATQPEEDSSASSSTPEDYKKLSLNELKKLVVSKGIQKDASKLKRQDLLKLLQDSA